MDDKKLDAVSDAIIAANANKRTSLRDLFANVSRFGEFFANKLPDDVEFMIVLSKKGEPHANVFVASYPTKEAIAKLKEVREDLKNGTLEGSWGERGQPTEADRRIIVDARERV